MRFIPEPELLAVLRTAVADKLGRPLTDFGNCDLLVKTLAQALPHRGGRGRATILRFFGLVSSMATPTRHTLDTLAAYAGFLDFATFSRVQLPPSAAAPAAADALVLLTGATYAESLLRGYALGQSTRPATPDGRASALALALAADPAGQEYFVESFVDLAYLNGAYGEVVLEYLRHATASQALIFGYSTLFLGAFLAQDEPAWRARLTQLEAVRVPPSLHPFPRGRRAFALLLAAWYDAPAAGLPAELLARIHQQAPTGSWAVGTTELPAFYNYFPAGYHFLVAEALFLTGQYAPLHAWLTLTYRQFPELEQPGRTVYHDLLQAFRAVAARHGAGPSAAPLSLPARQSAEASTHAWLWDYYQVHWSLAELYFAVADLPSGPDVAARCEQIREFAVARRMPFFNRVAQQILTAG
ncbi:hypothetical protein [Hymenobacter algoricola]|uniref:Uncharacterized protein n=1 Tax=Hymenobacter algoricola TaxID=486267 RepID=A0ABP7MPZ8_9BACT